MTLTHKTDNTESTLASNVEIADSRIQQARGLMFRNDISPDDEFALVMEFSKPKLRGIHSLFVPIKIDVIWVKDRNVTQVKTLNPYYGVGFSVADTVVELPSGITHSVEIGDSIEYKIEDK